MSRGNYYIECGYYHIYCVCMVQTTKKQLIYTYLSIKIYCFFMLSDSHLLINNCFSSIVYCCLEYV